ncbi:MAG: tssG [Akkermansiaceae bacterium]|nr:tssG [Akkermansiaceae bacterium]
MVSTPSTNPDDVERNRARGFVEAFGAEPCKTDFFSFVRWVEGMLPHMPRVGTGRRLADDPLIFHQTPYLHMAPATVQRVRALPERDGSGPVGRMEGFFLGLLGPSGPMPLSLTEYVWARSQGVPHPDRIAPITNTQVSIHRRDTSLEDFYNVFNHRFISFFYRAWASCRKALDYDRPVEARFSDFIGSFTGLGIDALRGRLDVPDEAVLYFAGHFSNGSRHAGGLAAVTADYFGTSAEVIENTGHWLDIPETDQCRLGGMGATPLGAGVVIGARIWDRQLRFTLRLGAMTLATYEKMFPGSPSLESLRSLVKYYTHRELFCDVNLVLKKEDYPGCRLGSGARLGLSTWLHSDTPAKDLDDLFIAIQ